jgi:CubicO group peptidase (beta-lactamase class C family)
LKRTLSITWLVLICLLTSEISFPLAAATRNAATAAKSSVPLAAQFSSLATADEDRLAQFELSLDSLRQQYSIPGLSAAIVNNGHIIWQRGYGFQDVENQIPATPATPYRIASLTKTFSSMLLMKCVEQGTLNLDSLISNYTAAIPEHNATVRHLFTHTSENPPGAYFRYSGSRYSSLTPVVDACTGRPFRQVLATNILDRLGMLDSVPGQDMEFPSPELAGLFTPQTLQRYSNVIHRLAKPYTLNSQGEIVPSSYPNRGISTSAGLISTVRDVARYDAAIDKHTLLQPQTQELAWTNATSNLTGQTLPYALGWFVEQYGGERLIWHYGLWPGSFSSLILKVPGRNVTLILLANSDGLSAPFVASARSVSDSPFANLFVQMLDDPEAFKANPIDAERFFVRQHYLDFLGREPDQGGLDYWSGKIAQCANDAACIHSQRIGVSAAFFIEQEFQETGNFLYRLYKSSLGRRPTFNEFMPDRSQLRGGSQLEVSKQVFADQWVQRAEFAQKYPAGQSGAEFIDALIQTVFQNAGVDISSQRAALVGDYESNGSRARIVRMVADNPAFQQAEYNRAFVLMQYFGYLRRNPDANGYQFWQDVLNRAPESYRGMVCAFLTSAEYQSRFGIRITRTNSDCAE